MRLAYSSAAERDVKKALDHYKREAGPKIAEDFINRLETKVAKIVASPESCRVA